MKPTEDIMKFFLKNIQQSAQYEPKEVTILLETAEEARAFHHLFGCGTIVHCNNMAAALEIKEKIYSQIIERLPV
jgi:hypothetical protein